MATDLSTLQTWANGNVDGSNLSAAAAQSAGVNQNAQTVKGVTNIAASESATNTGAYTTLATPDQVASIVLPTNGLIAVTYQATWAVTSGTVAASAAIFLGANQAKVSQTTSGVFSGAASGTPAAQAATMTVTSGGTFAGSLTTLPGGLGPSPITVGATGAVTYGGDATTGQIVGIATGGGPCVLFAAAGTYTVAIKFNVNGTITVSNRRLCVEALSFS